MPQIHRVVFASNQSSIQLQNCKFTNNRALIVGGVAAAEVQSFVSIIDSSAFNCTSELGGVVYTLYYCTVYVEKSQFDGCKVLTAGGTFAVVLFSKLIAKDCEFTNNTVEHFDGGAVYLSNYSSAFINGSQFSMNKAKRARGGAILLVGSAYATIINCKFSKNSATQNGGAIYLNTGSKLQLTQTTFVSNAADMGGAINTEANAKAKIEESTFVRNTASSFGGTFCFFQSNYVLIKNTQIFESLADTGIVYMLQSTVQAENVVIKNNFGSVYVINSEFRIILGNTSFENNVPKITNEIESCILKLNEGGAITMFRGSIIMNGTSYFHNNSAENGAAIHAISSNILVNETVTMTNNTARYNGGGLYLYYSRMQCKLNCFLTLNGNHAIYNGGGIYAVSSTIDVGYYYNRDDKDQLPFFLLYKNIAQTGGVLYW